MQKDWDKMPGPKELPGEVPIIAVQEDGKWISNKEYLKRLDKNAKKPPKQTR